MSPADTDTDTNIYTVTYWMQFGITNPNDSEGLMDLAACHSHIVFLVTGRGNVVGSAVVPCIKITGNSATYRAMEEDMDFDAGPVLEVHPTVFDEWMLYVPRFWFP